MGYISEIRRKVGYDAIFMPASVGGIIDGNRILLQKRIDTGNWGLHGGALELGETFEQALIRKLQEEINITPIKYEFLNLYSGMDEHDFYPNNDEVYCITVLYLISEYDGILNANHERVSELKWFDFDNLPDNLQPHDVKYIDYLKKYCIK